MKVRDQAVAAASIGVVTEPRLAVAIARSAADVEDAQRLRYKIFAEEMGAQVGDRITGLDADEFDPHCDHLIVRDQDSLRVVGTYRILPPHAARARVGGCTTRANSISHALRISPRPCSRSAARASIATTVQGRRS